MVQGETGSRTFIVLGEPQGKGRHRMTRSGHTYTPKETVQYENWIKLCYQEKYGDALMLEGEIMARIDAYYGIPKAMPKYKRVLVERDEIHPTKKPDADNIAKAILDSLNGIAYKDDAAIVQLHVYKHFSEQPFVEVTLKQI